MYDSVMMYIFKKIVFFFRFRYLEILVSLFSSCTIQKQ